MDTAALGSPAVHSIVDDIRLGVESDFRPRTIRGRGQKGLGVTPAMSLWSPSDVSPQRDHSPIGTYNGSCCPTARRRDPVSMPEPK